jgi:sugar transferase (PEP-CTERM system associated)
MIRVFNQYISSKSLFLAVWEAVLIALCVAGAAKLRFWGSPAEFDSYTMFPDFGLQVLATIVVFQACFYYNELYALPMLARPKEQMLRLSQALGAACMLLGFLYFVIPGIRIGRGVLFISVALLASATALSRATLDLTWRTALTEKILVLGAGPLAIKVARELTRRNDLSIKLAGFVDKNAEAGATLFSFPILGQVDSLQRIVAGHRITRIIVALEDQRGVLPIEALVNLRVRGIPVEDAHTSLAALTGRVWLEAVKPSWFVYSDGFHRSRLTVVLKRAFDLCFGIIGLVLSAPLMALIAVAVRLDSPGPALYRQMRVGLAGTLFGVLKFRTMCESAEHGAGAQWARVDDPRITRLGKFLRKYRLDELPQFLNVIRAEMSFVGPRPERPVFVEQLRRQIPYYDERHSVRPGITGWAQVQYPYSGTVEESARKLEYDLFYLKNMSIVFDCAILLRTVRAVLCGFGSR